MVGVQEDEWRGQPHREAPRHLQRTPKSSAVHSCEEKKSPERIRLKLTAGGEQGSVSSARLDDLITHMH